ncbi:efflux RND transporter permease subunit [Streptosporangium lutulentum]
MLVWGESYDDVPLGARPHDRPGQVEPCQPQPRHNDRAGVERVRRLRDPLAETTAAAIAFVPGGVRGRPYQGASPEIVEEQVTKPIESSFQGIGGVTELTSTSREGMAQVQVAFEYGTDIDAAVAEMQQAVSRIEAQLPAGWSRRS